MQKRNRARRWRRGGNERPAKGSLEIRISRRGEERNKEAVSTHCNTLQHTATHGIALQHIATHCDTLRHTATHCDTLQHTAIHCDTLRHIVTHCNTLQHTATHSNCQEAMSSKVLGDVEWVVSHMKAPCHMTQAEQKIKQNREFQGLYKVICMSRTHALCHI